MTANSSGLSAMTAPSACSSTMGAMQTATSGHGQFDRRNRRFAPGRIFVDGGYFRNLGADPAVRRHWDRRNRVGYVRDRHDRIVQSNLVGFVSNHGLAEHRRPRRNSDGIHRARNGRH
jgi:hypothetical protein